MTNVMFRWIFSPARIEDLPHRMLYCHWVLAFLHSVHRKMRDATVTPDPLRTKGKYIQG